MAPRTFRRSLVSGMLCLITSLLGPVVRADPVYTVTNLGSGTIAFTTAGGGTISGSAGQLLNSDLATSQLVSVSNGQVSYSFSTTPDTPLQGGQGPLSGLPANFLNPNPSVYGQPFLSGLSNANGYAAIAADLPLRNDPGYEYSTAYPFQLAPNGQIATGQGGAQIIADPAVGPGSNLPIYIMGINTANQALVGTGILGSGAIVYNIATSALTNLNALPAFSTPGRFFNPSPLAIDNQGQIILFAGTESPSGTVQDALLLTPDGEPVVITPEPGTWVIWSLIGGASFAAARRRTRAPAA